MSDILSTLPELDQPPTRQRCARRPSVWGSPGSPAHSPHRQSTLRRIALHLAKLRVDDLHRPPMLLSRPAHQGPGVALIRPDVLEAREGISLTASSTCWPPLRSGRLAAWTTTESKSPSVSTRIWRLTPDQLLVPVVAAQSAHERLDRLALDNRGTGGGIAAGMEPGQLAQVRMDRTQMPIATPLPKVVLDASARRHTRAGASATHSRCADGRRHHW